MPNANETGSAIVRALMAVQELRGGENRLGTKVREHGLKKGEALGI